MQLSPLAKSTGSAGGKGLLVRFLFPMNSEFWLNRALKCVRIAVPRRCDVSRGMGASGSTTPLPPMVLGDALYPP